jgi:hypothetical protein
LIRAENEFKARMEVQQFDLDQGTRSGALALRLTHDVGRGSASRNVQGEQTGSKPAG